MSDPSQDLPSAPQPACAQGRSHHSSFCDCHQVTNIIGHAGTAQCCGFLFGTRYHFQMRCRRSLARGYWSEWSPGRNYTTHEKGGCGVTRGCPLPGQAAQPWWHGRAHPSQLPACPPVAAPTGKLDVWWSTRPARVGKGLEVQLCWKVSTGGVGTWGNWGITLGTEHPCGY